VKEIPIKKVEMEIPNYKSELVVVDRDFMVIRYVGKKPSWWWRMWYYLLLGWTWHDLA